MSDNLESGHNVSEAGGQANPQASGAGGDEQASLVEQIIAKLEPLIDKRVQSVKDRRFAKLEGEQEELSAFLNAYARRVGHQVNPDAVHAAQKDVELEQMLTDYRAGRTSNSAAPANEVPRENLADLLAALDLDANSPDVLNTIAAGKTSKSDLVDLKLRLSRPANPASISAPVQSGGQRIPDTERLVQEYQSKLAELSRKPGVKNMALERRNLRRQYQEKGVPGSRL